MNFIFDKSSDESRGKIHTERGMGGANRSDFTYSILAKHNKDNYLLLPALEPNFNNLIAVEYD